MDEFIKHLILDNKLTLTLLATFFTPLGLSEQQERLSSPANHNADQLTT